MHEGQGILHVDEASDTSSQLRIVKSMCNTSQAGLRVKLGMRSCVLHVTFSLCRSCTSAAWCVHFDARCTWHDAHYNPVHLGSPAPEPPPQLQSLLAPSSTVYRTAALGTRYQYYQLRPTLATFRTSSCKYVQQMSLFMHCPAPNKHRWHPPPALTVLTTSKVYEGYSCLRIRMNACIPSTFVGIGVVILCPAYNSGHVVGVFSFP